MTPIIAADGQSMTLIFDQYVASIGPGIALTEKRKNCVINLDVHVPQGFSFAIANVDYRGFVSLDPMIAGTQQATYWFRGERHQSTKRTLFTGPVETDYLEGDQFDIATLVWSKCGVTSNLNINTSVLLTALPGASPRAKGMMTTDTADGKIQQIFNFAWKKCE